jgi:glycerophosphoryl diester phosphodiesterase
VSSSPSSGPPDVQSAEARQPAATTRAFYSIAHRAGNNLHATEEALNAGVDAIECDFWHARGRLALRHERKFPGIPLLYDKWFVRWQWGELSLRELLLAINRRAELFLDVKSSTPRAADAVLELYHDHASMMPRTLVCSKQWKLLDRLGAAGTDMKMYYSVGRTGNVNALLRRAERDHPPAGTSIRHSHLNADVVRRLHDAGLQVLAWTVNNQDRAGQLVDWGVDGIISDDLSILQSLERATADPPPAS